MSEPMGAAGNAPVLSVRGLSRVLAGRAVVAELDFDMAAGEVLAVLGPSGSGKTSLLRMVAGLDAPSAGSIRLFGQEVSAPGRVLVPPERRALGLAFQDATLFPHLDAVGNAAFGIHAPDKATREQRSRQALADMGLQDMDGRDVGTLSGGEAQRVSLARALAAQARLLLLDEPFANVDRLTRADLVQRLKARLAHVEGAIVITHDPADAAELGARVLLMRAGRLVADGSPQALAAGEAGDWARHFMQTGR
ncbi:ABC-type spermidine/putrescine transport system, ATPase component [Burkholderiales bacterium JOSHI_001]|nr:ABC-type spermidine/putrescine transport system, ATPase component [Burkholderiales bacterium JOSHI_001]